MEETKFALKKKKKKNFQLLTDRPGMGVGVGAAAATHLCFYLSGEVQRRLAEDKGERV